MGQVEAKIDIFVRLSNRKYGEIMESVEGWQFLAVAFSEFGIVVLVISTATASIVESTKKLGR